jgi:hypothetical protein
MMYLLSCLSKKLLYLTGDIADAVPTFVATGLISDNQCVVEHLDKFQSESYGDRFNETLNKPLIDPL